ncbi:MAG: bis(5-nucleosyl)-tetraphosphatase, symmetrical [Gammaproteobacteria bacterium]|jgi:bis(5'-nucleosyl)-tetraphosphatase (symmetrical)|nr:bis(5-nucleosyl)-tetraphosphatase, symmetrical [Gammaproteobacteria bacterium]
MATYAIGDIQGCLSRLQALLNQLNFDPKQDRLWFAGDLINRGPESLQTLRFIKSLGQVATVVLGNHDLHLLAVASGTSSVKPQDTLTEILKAPDCDELCQWLRQQKLLHEDPKLGYVLVHAGFVPQWDLTKAKQCAHEVEQVLQGRDYVSFLNHMYGNLPLQWREELAGWERLRFITNCFTRIRFCDKEGRLDLTAKEGIDKAPPGYMPWFAVPKRKNQNTRILFGHWAALQGQAQGINIFPLDGGCVWGGKLLAMRLEDGKRFQIACD